jgi:hypothetical protein
LVARQTEEETSVAPSSYPCHRQKEKLEEAPIIISLQVPERGPAIIETSPVIQNSLQNQQHLENITWKVTLQISVTMAGLWDPHNTGTKFRVGPFSSRESLAYKISKGRCKHKIHIKS